MKQKPSEGTASTESDLHGRIEGATKVLGGKTLWKCTRAADMACFQFGMRTKVEDSRGREREVGEYALHVQCAWRLREKDRVIVGRQDLYYPAEYEESEPYPENFDWEHGPNRHDKRLDSFFGNRAREFLIEEVEAGCAGSFQLKMSGDFSLEIFPFNSLDDEHWRLFEPGKENSHFVVTGKGIES